MLLRPGPIAALTARLEPVLPAVQDVEAGALARIAEAETAMAAAVARAQARRGRTEPGPQRGPPRRAAAQTERHAAVARAQTAEREAADAVAQAARDTAEARKAQGRAEAEAETRAATVARETERRRALEAQHDDVRAQLRDARAEVARGTRGSIAANSVRSASTSAGTSSAVRGGITSSPASGSRTLPGLPLASWVSRSAKAVHLVISLRRASSATAGSPTKVAKLYPLRLPLLRREQERRRVGVPARTRHERLPERSPSRSATSTR
nr:hypothetical protein [Micromonospora rosaria]